MRINKHCFKKLYDNCCEIINQSTDKNIKIKINRLNISYQELCNSEDTELQEFYSIVFELKVYDYIKNKKIEIIARNDNIEGPDFDCVFGYLECISTTKGQIEKEGSNYVNRMLASREKHLSAIPRISSAIKAKKDKYLKYIEHNTVDLKKPKIIAVGTSIFANEFQGSSCIEDTMKILYAIGNQYLLIDKKNNCIIDTPNLQNRIYDKFAKKHDNNNLELDYFFNTEYEQISAVILICNLIFEEINSSNFKIFLNPNAFFPIDKSKISQFDYFSLADKNDNGVAVFKWNEKQI